MKTKFIILSLSLCFFFSTVQLVNAQVNKLNDYKTMAEQPDANFFTIVKETRAQLSEMKKSLSTSMNGKENSEFRELNAQFERWVWRTKGQVSKDGKIAPSGTGWENYLMAHPEFLKMAEKKDRSSTTWTNFSPFTGYAPNDSTHANGWTYGYGIGRINVVRQHPTNKNKFYAGGAAGGVFVSTDYCENWLPLTDQFGGLGVSDLVINPTNPDQLLLATGDYDGGHIKSIGIFKSVNGGTSWTQAYTFTLNQNKLVAHILFDPANSNNVLATTSDNILKSTDGGSSWSVVYTSAAAKLNDIVITTSGAYFVSSRTGLLVRSTDGGSIWTSIATGKTDRVDLDYHAGSNTIYLLGETNPAFRKYNVTTSSFVAAWSNVSTSGPVVAYNSQSGYNQVICVNPANANDIIVGEFNAKRTLNGGTSWINYLNGYYDIGDWGGFYVHSDHHFMQYLPSTDTILNGNDGGVYIGKASTNDWMSKFKGLAITQSYSMAITQTSPEFFIFGNQDNDGHSRADGPGGTFRWYNAQAGDGTCTAINPTNSGQRLLGGTEGALARVTDGYAGSPFGTSITPAGGTASFVFPLETHPSGNLFYAGYDEIRKYNFTTDTWTTMGDPNGANNLIESIELSNNTSTTTKMYVMSDDADQYKIYRSVNDGSTFSAVADPSATQFTKAVACSKTNVDSVFAISRGYNAADKVFISIDGGANWTNITNNMPNIQMTAIKLKQGSDTLFVGTELGLYFIKLGAAVPTWAKYGSGLPNVIITEIEINYTSKKLYVSTFGRGAWLIDLGNFALPINDLTFEANKLSNSDNEYNVSWTWNEESLIKVELQKSENGIDFSTIQKVELNPASTSTKKVTVLKSKEYYRLKGTFNNGNSAFSNVLILSSTANANHIYIYPNPSNGIVNVSSMKNIKHVRITDIRGSQIAFANPNSTNYSVNLDFVPNGIYFIEIINDKDELVKEKIILSK